MRDFTANLLFKLLLACLLSSIVLFSGCKGKETSVEKAAVKALSISSVEIEDKGTLKDSKGVPVAVRVVSEVTASGRAGDSVSGSCKPRYASELVDEGFGFNGAVSGSGTFAATMLLISPAKGRLDLSKWNVCCTLVTAENFNSVDDKTVCSK